jgi:putative oxidoreductase
MSGFTTIFDWLQSVLAFGIRYYLFSIFFLSGWVKLQSWQSTLYLFEYEYKVPVISAQSAAFLGTASELILPTLMLLGLGGRIPAFIMFWVNVVMAYSYPFLFTGPGACALKDHIIWGILIAILVFYGPGRISVDNWLKKKYCKHYKY